MLESKPKSTELRGFEDAKIKIYAYILEHAVRVLQKNEEMITEFTLAEYVSEFKTTPEIQSAKQLFAYMMELEELGYMVISAEKPKVTMTEKFFDLCERAKKVNK